MEIELSRRLVQSGLILLLILAPLLVGLQASPVTEAGRPLLLTPRLARLNDYRQEVRGWVVAMQKTEDGLAALLEAPVADLFAQNEQANRLYQRMEQVVEAIDQTPAPPTFEPLHDLLGQSASAYLEATLAAARWVSEPSDENYQSAQTALASARALLERLIANPWITD